ncbi:unnamed protein product [Amoebophrya sp. A120]|nr:unnamed protein product [Amoebophrya sp. A120]|eukprot:GSA120T00012954001.1
MPNTKNAGRQPKVKKKKGSDKKTATAGSASSTAPVHQKKKQTGGNTAGAAAVGTGSASSSSTASVGANFSSIQLPGLERDAIQLPTKVVKKAEKIASDMLEFAYSWEGGGTSLGNALWEDHLFAHIDAVRKEGRMAIMSLLAAPPSGKNYSELSADEKDARDVEREKVDHSQLGYLLGIALFLGSEDGLALLADNDLLEEDEEAVQGLFDTFALILTQILRMAGCRQANSKSAEEMNVECSSSSSARARQRLGLRSEQDEQTLLAFLFKVQKEIIDEFGEEILPTKMVQKVAKEKKDQPVLFELVEVAPDEDDEDGSDDMVPIDPEEMAAALADPNGGCAQQ